MTSSPRTPALALDVLEHIMAWSPPRTITRVMRTCRDLYGLGPKHLLRHGVTLHKMGAIPSFCDFINSEYPRRFAFFRALHIKFRVPQPYRLGAEFTPAELAGLILVLADEALQLDTLSISDADDILAFCDFDRAVVRIKTIKTLVLVSGDARSRSFLERMASQVVTAKLDVPSLQHHYLINRHRHTGGPTAFSVLQHSKHTLTTLRWECPSDDAFDAFNELSSPVTLTFPRLRTLTITYTGDITSPFIDIAQCAKAFPNLVELEITPVDHYMRRAICTTVGEMRMLLEVRERNQRMQRSFGTWSTLARCSGDVVGLFGIALHGTTVQDLRICQQTVPLDDMDNLRSVLSDTRPTTLSLSVLGREALIDGRSGLVTILRHSESPALRSLKVEVVFGVAEYRASSADVIDEVVSSFARLPSSINSLILVLDYHLLQRHWRSIRMPSESRCPVEQYLAAADLPTIAIRICAMAPNLTAADVRISERCLSLHGVVAVPLRDGSPTRAMTVDSSPFARY